MRKINLTLYVESSNQEAKARKVLTEAGVADEGISAGRTMFGTNKLVVKRVKPKTYKTIMKALGSTHENVYVNF